MKPSGCYFGRKLLAATGMQTTLVQVPETSQHMQMHSKMGSIAMQPAGDAPTTDPPTATVIHNSSGSVSMLQSENSAYSTQLWTSQALKYALKYANVRDCCVRKLTSPKWH
jgi:hypothetical protein